MDNDQLIALKSDIQTSLTKIEEGAATKATVKKLEDQFKALQGEQDRRHLENKTDRIFANKANALDFLNTLRGAISKSYLAQEGKVTKESGFYIEKSDLNSYGTGTGVELIPTATSDVLSLLLVQASLPRQVCTVYNGLHGNLVLPKRAGGSTANFTASGGNLVDDAAVTASAFTTSSITLSPKQISAISLVSEKALYASAVNISENVAIDLIEQAGLLENTVCYKGDGTATAGNGSITGLKSASGLGLVTVAAATFAGAPIDSMLDCLGKVHQSVMSDPNAEFYISGALDPVIRKSKASTSGVYNYSPATGTYVLAGKKVNFWHIMDAPSTLIATNVPVIYGNMRKAVSIGLGRDMGVEVSRDFKFGTNQSAFRLSYDFDMGVIQPGALARVVLS